jgi:hypothetical protein
MKIGLMWSGVSPDRNKSTDFSAWALRSRLYSRILPDAQEAEVSDLLINLRDVVVPAGGYLALSRGYLAVGGS